MLYLCKYYKYSITKNLLDYKNNKYYQNNYLNNKINQNTKYKIFFHFEILNNQASRQAI